MARVLIIEDERSLRETLATFLRREGHEVIAAANGREAFERALTASPEVLVADWMLQNHIHGLHVSETFSAVNPELNTILITGFPSRDLVAESHRSGVFELLEKPFGLSDLRDAVLRAAATPPAPSRVRPIAVVQTAQDGRIDFASLRARELFEGCDVQEPGFLAELMGAADIERLAAAGRDWVDIRPKTARPVRWSVRARRSDDGDECGLLLVLVDADDDSARSDPRVRILLDNWSRSQPLLHDSGPVVVIERDGAVRRLLVSQLERIGALCYTTDDLEDALRLLTAEPRATTVLVDFALAGDELESWARRIERARPGTCVIATGGVGSEEELLKLGVDRVLPKPWRITDLLDVLAEAQDTADSR